MSSENPNAMSNVELGKILGGLRVEDVRMDRFGRIIINNPDIVKQLGALKPAQVASDDDNIACCENGYQCGCK